MTTRILRGHVLDRLAELPDDSVHCCVSSPPYFGLRSYGTEPQVWDGELNCDHQWGDECIAKSGRNDSGTSPSSGVGFHGQAEGYGGDRTASQGSFCRHCNAWRGSLGLEPSPELYIAHLVEVFRKVRRVLRKDGTLWLNIGDSYSSGSRSYPQVAQTLTGPANPEEGSRRVPANIPGIKPKDLLGIPWMLAFALRDDGWYLRSEITWCKRAPMPESVTDRPTSATEKVFLLTKSPRYFYDAEAVKEEATDTRGGLRFTDARAGAMGREASGNERSDRENDRPASRNMRNWWWLGPEPFPEAHFATFPTEIPRKAILAGTSERGVCPKCGAPWERVLDKSVIWPEKRGGTGGVGANRNDRGLACNADRSAQTIGWNPICSCDAEVPVSATVLDPFLGAGTTALVADQLGRDCIGIELNTEYAQMAERRLRDDAGMFAQVGE